jgi:outer membrane protein OmpA-like peptidoglycan-associated protein
MLNRKLVSTFLGVAVAASGLVGCATTKSVDKKIMDATSQTDKKIETLGGQVEDLQQRQTKTEARVEELGRSAAEALQRAEEAGVLAQGKVVFQQTFSEDRVKFRTGSFDLSKDSKAALDEMAEKVKAVGHGVYLEIQGHTDDTGSTSYNDMLGLQRAEAVRRYLSRQHSLPLGRMSTISYGDTLPVATNKTKAGRSQNRRVVVVVLE